MALYIKFTHYVQMKIFAQMFQVSLFYKPIFLVTDHT